MVTNAIAYAVTDRVDELERRLGDHIAQETAEETAQEAAGRELRASINRHSEERCKEIEAAYAHWRRETERSAARIKKEILRKSQRNAFVLRCCGPAIVVAIVGFLYATGGVSGWVAAPIVALADLAFIGNIVAYLTRNRKKAS